MTHCLKRRTIYSACITSLALSISLWISPVMLAKYRPPKKPSAPKETVTNTTRGGTCEAKSSASLTPLVPFSHVGQTSSQHPTFTWFVPDRAPHPQQFRLFKPNGQLVYSTEMQSQSGLMSITLPPNQPKLAIGQLYQWQVVLVCDPNVPSMNAMAVAEIQVVEPTASLQAQLADAPTPQRRIDLYAESGLWYDAIAEARKISETPQNQVAVMDLLESLARAEVQPLKDWTDRLKQIEAVKRRLKEEGSF